MGILGDDTKANTDSTGRLAVRLFRWGASAPRLVRPVFTILLRVLCGVDLPLSVKAGGGLRLPHGARGAIFHPATVLGSEVTVYHGVTLGVDGRGGTAAPTVGDRAYIGAGACILGGITIGEGAVVGANAVVLHDVPAGTTAVGVPARILERTL